MKTFDGTEVFDGQRTWILHDDFDARASWEECSDCGATGSGVAFRSGHTCVECPGCHERFPELPVVDAVSGARYCDDDCLDGASERYWTAVWSA